MLEATIFTELQRNYPAVKLGCDPMRFGQVLAPAGLKKRNTEVGNVYEVVKRKAIAETA